MLKIKKLLLFTLLLFITVISNAQVTTSSMSGVVKNDAGEGLAGATITALHQPTGTRYTSVTRTGGRFDILNMNPGGPYIVTVTFVGFQEGKRTDVYLSLGDEYRLDFNMSNTATEISEVVVSGQRNRALKSGASTNINNRQINTLPTISRSINDFTRLTPQAGPGNTFNGRDGRFNN
ncbi:MAG TPA: carboxypeptidase-like regulatory domain-containing protein, partial [Lacibacter sp.]|nr:carboxypeptidase-like regulatory domain-containing protein [Lacibacter sp.]